MIAFVAGRVAALAPDGAVVEVGGVGLTVQCTPATIAALRIGEPAHLPTSLVVREDSLTLYGFADEDERVVFELLQTASGVGPRLAQAMLAVHGPDTLRRAVATEDLAALTQVPGIGRKGAQRIVLELKDRLGAVRGGSPAGGRAPRRTGRLARPAARRPARPGLVVPGGRRGGGLGRPVRRGVGRRGRAAGRRRPAQGGPAIAEPGMTAAAGGTERLVDPGVELTGVEDEVRVEAALRPRTLGEFIGQHRVREQLSLVLDAAKGRGRVPDHVLLSGSPGLGKTTLAMIIAAEIEQPLRITSGPAIQHAGDLAAILSSLTEGEVLFLDEIHRMSRPAEEMLYMAMEDFRVDVVVGKGPGATAIPLEIPPFTLVGATTRAGLLPGPLRDRFGFTAHMDFYEAADLERVLTRSARLLGVQLTAGGGTEIAGRSRGTPRIANRLLRRVRDFAQVRADGVVTEEVAREALLVYEVDERGLDRLDRAVLQALVGSFGGGPVGVSTLAVAVGEERETVEEVAEPFLVRAGLLARTPRGRVATPAAWAHLGLTPPRGTAGAAVAPDLFDDVEGGRTTADAVPTGTTGRLPPGLAAVCAGRPLGRILTTVESLPFFVLILVAFYLLIIRPQRARAKAAQQLQESLAPGVEVMTTAGLYGTLTEVRDDSLLIEVSPGVTLRFAKAAVGRIVTDDADDEVD